MRFVLVCLSLLFLAGPLSAQKRFVISGTIEDKSSGEKLIGATVRIKELANSTETLLAR